MRSHVALRVVRVGVILIASVGLTMLEVGCRAPGPNGRGLGDTPEAPLREFRAVFVTTAYNLDWPSKPGLHWRLLTDEINAIVRRTKELNCNVIILQVRAFGDRIHRRSRLPASEPWAAALNRRHDPDPRPDPRFDPLAVWITACHAQGIELHAWVNPFRVDNLVEAKRRDRPHPTTLPVSATDDGQHLYLNPTNADVQSYVIDVIRDLLEYEAAENTSRVRRAAATSDDGDYAGIDGVVFDHFPYPKQIGSQPVSLRPGDAAAGADREDPSEGRVSSAGPGTTRPASPRIRWLLKKAGRQPPDPNPVTIDQFIEKVFTEVHTHRGLKFGFSPMYNDNKAREWLAKGWVNYVVPELYFPRGASDRFKSTLEWWLVRVPSTLDFTPIVVAGLFTKRVQLPAPHADSPWPADEILAQIGDARSARSNISNADARGQAHYSWFALRSPEQGGPSDASNNVGDRLKAGPYARPALVPQCTKPPADVPAPGRPDVRWKRNRAGHTVTWGPADPNILAWAVWLRQDHRWGQMQVFGGFTRRLDLPPTVDRVAVKAIDRFNRESEFGICP
jgi:hypothetical protein